MIYKENLPKGLVNYFDTLFPDLPEGQGVTLYQIFMARKGWKAASKLLKCFLPYTSTEERACVVESFKMYLDPLFDRPVSDNPLDYWRFVLSGKAVWAHTARDFSKEAREAALQTVVATVLSELAKKHTRPNRRDLLSLSEFLMEALRLGRNIQRPFNLIRVVRVLTDCEGFALGPYGGTFKLGSKSATDGPGHNYHLFFELFKKTAVRLKFCQEDEDIFRVVQCFSYRQNLLTVSHMHWELADLYKEQFLYN
jgi:hypothetical protein